MTTILRWPLLAILLSTTLAANAYAADTEVYEEEFVIERDVAGPLPPVSGTRVGRTLLPKIQKLTLIPVDKLRQRPVRRKVRSSKAKNRCADLQNADPSIKSCSPNFVIRAGALPNDTYFPYLWGLRNSGSRPDIRATQAWDIFQGSAQTIVGVLDTGIDYSHPDLVANAWVNPAEIPGNGIDDDGNGYIDDLHGINAITRSGNPMDDNSHGTHISGIIAGAGNNSRGVVGISWQSKIIAAKFLDATGSGDLFSEVRAIDYLVDLKRNRGVDISAINASYGSSTFAEVEFNAVARARDAGIVFVTAAGNAGSDNDLLPSYPANHPLSNIISVAAIDIEGNLSKFSNYGASLVHIAAPGEDIVSTVPGGAYAGYSGTSMAAPHVTGAVALLKGYHPEFSMAKIRSQILDSGTPLRTLHGLVSSGKLLNLASMLTGQSAPEAPSSEAERYDVVAGKDLPGLKKVVRSRDKLYINLTSSGEIGGSASLLLGVNGANCSQAQEVNIPPGQTVTLRGRLKNLRPSATISFLILNSQLTATGAETLQFVGKKRGKINNAKVCKAFYKSLKVYVNEK